ncbi:hypothetical protein C1H46_023882 [Malus baccata]|uniref:DNA2/NAM7 helicase-like C-terminal domain-containing protein n=1 Tax=Malus baccata TaxID=106549 RepID=A0A540LVY0_MALBA|nr:hypothetical protein C1H46_023882 [Malus baccata]
MCRNLKIINEVLCTGSMDKKNYDLCSARNEDSPNEQLIESLCSKLNESQTRSVRACIRSLHIANSSVELIQGPAEVAIMEVASIFMKIVNGAKSNALFCPLGEILLFGNEERWKVSPEIEEICLDYHVERLAKCLGPEETELENLFSCQQVAEDLYIPEVAETMDYKSLQLCMRRSECLSVLKVPMVPPNILFIEEAAQVKEWELTIPLQLLGVKHAILVGVEYQLPAIVKSNVSDGDGFSRSLFERLSSLGHPKHILDMQYRMQSSISLSPNYKFYHNQIMDTPNNGYVRKRKLCIGVMSPYAGQVVVIRDKIGNRYDKLDGFIVKVKIVDDYQGGEEDNVLWILVSSSFHKHVNALAEAFEKIDNTYSDCELWG